MVVKELADAKREGNLEKIKELTDLPRFSVPTLKLVYEKD